MTILNLNRRLRKMEAGMMNSEVQKKFDAFDEMLRRPNTTPDEVQNCWGELEAQHPEEFKKFWDTNFLSFLTWINGCRGPMEAAPEALDAAAAS